MHSGLKCRVDKCSNVLDLLGKMKSNNLLMFVPKQSSSGYIKIRLRLKIRCSHLQPGNLHCRCTTFQDSLKLTRHQLEMYSRIKVWPHIGHHVISVRCSRILFHYSLLICSHKLLSIWPITHHSQLSHLHTHSKTSLIPIKLDI